MSSTRVDLIVVFKRADDARKFASYWARRGADESGLRARGWPEHHEWLNAYCKRRGALVRAGGDAPPGLVIDKLLPELQRRAVLMIVDAFYSAVGEREKWFALAGKRATAEQAMARARDHDLPASLLREVKLRCRDEDEDEENVDVEREDEPDTRPPPKRIKSLPAASKRPRSRRRGGLSDPQRPQYLRLYYAVERLRSSLIFDNSFPYGMGVDGNSLTATYITKRAEARDALREIELLIEGGLEVPESIAAGLRWLCGGSQRMQKLLDQRGVARKRLAPQELPRDPVWWVLCLSLRHYDRRRARRCCAELAKLKAPLLVEQIGWVMVELTGWRATPPRAHFDIEAHVTALGDTCLITLMQQRERLKRHRAAWKHLREIIASLTAIEGGAGPYTRVGTRMEELGAFHVRVNAKTKVSS